MINLTSVNYEDPQQSPNCSLLLRVACEPHPTNGETALDNARAFVERVKLLADTPLANGGLALDSDGHLLSLATLAYLIKAAEQRGRESVAKKRLWPRVEAKKVAKKVAKKNGHSKRRGKSR